MDREPMGRGSKDRGSMDRGSRDRAPRDRGPRDRKPTAKKQENHWFIMFFLRTLDTFDVHGGHAVNKVQNH